VINISYFWVNGVKMGEVDVTYMTGEKEEKKYSTLRGPNCDDNLNCKTAEPQRNACQLCFLQNVPFLLFPGKKTGRAD